MLNEGDSHVGAIPNSVGAAPCVGRTAMHYAVAVRVRVLDIRAWRPRIDWARATATPGARRGRQANGQGDQSG